MFIQPVVLKNLNQTYGSRSWMVKLIIYDWLTIVVAFLQLLYRSRHTIEIVA